MHTCTMCLWMPAHLRPAGQTGKNTRIMLTIQIPLTATKMLDHAPAHDDSPNMFASYSLHMGRYSKSPAS